MIYFYGGSSTIFHIYVSLLEGTVPYKNWELSYKTWVYVSS